MTNPDAAVPTMPNTTNTAKALDLGGGELSLGGVSPFMFLATTSGYRDCMIMVHGTSVVILQQNNEGGYCVDLDDHVKQK